MNQTEVKISLRVHQAIAYQEIYNQEKVFNS